MLVKYSDGERISFDLDQILCYRRPTRAGRSFFPLMEITKDQGLHEFSKKIDNRLGNNFFCLASSTPKNSIREAKNHFIGVSEFIG